VGGNHFICSWYAAVKNYLDITRLCYSWYARIVRPRAQKWFAATWGPVVEEVFQEEFHRWLRPVFCVEKEDYTILLSSGWCGSRPGSVVAHFFWDAPYGFCFLYKGMPIACVSFTIGEDYVCIWQLQGRSGCEHLLAPFRWERFFTAVVIEAAKRLGWKQVRMIAAFQSKWYKQWHNPSPQRCQRMKMRYDTTAKRMRLTHNGKKRKFFWDKRVKRYVLDLQ